MDLDQLLERCKQGDGLAWEQIVRQHQSRVFALAYHYTGNREEARDLAQEVFVRVFQNLGSCATGQHFLPWLIRITRNICIDQIRRKKARPPAQDIPADEIRTLSDFSLDPAQSWEAKSRRNLLRRALQNLSELSREIIIMKEIQGLKFEEISTLLNVPMGTLKSRSHRARIELAKSVLALAGEAEGTAG